MHVGVGGGGTGEEKWLKEQSFKGNSETKLEFPWWGRGGGWWWEGLNQKPSLGR